jgi:hypothetical protein
MSLHKRSYVVLFHRSFSQIRILFWYYVLNIALNLDVSTDAIYTVLRLFKYDDEVQRKGTEILLKICRHALRHNPQELARHLGVVYRAVHFFLSIQCLQSVQNLIFLISHCVLSIKDCSYFSSIGTNIDNSNRTKMLRDSKYHNFEQ